MGTININKRDVIWSYLGTFFRIAVNVIILPFVLKYLNDEELGLWYVFSTVSYLAVLLDFGFAPALARNIAYIWCGAKELKKDNVQRIQENETDYLEFKIILTTCKCVYGCIATLGFVLLLCIGTPYIINIGSSSALIPWIIYIIGVFFNMLYSYYSSFLRGVGALAQNNKAAVISRLVQIFLTLTLLLRGYGLLGVCISYLVSGFALRISSMMMFNKYENIGKNLAVIKSKVDWERVRNTFKIVWYNASKDGLVTLSNYLCTQANTLICSYSIGLATTGSYGFSMQIAMVMSNIAQTPYTIIHPKLQETAIKGQGNQSSQLLANSIIKYLLLFIIMLIGVLLLIPVIKWFKPTFNIDRTMLLTIFIYYLIYDIYHLFASYISTYNTLPYTKSFIITAIVSVFVSFIFVDVFKMGIWALILSPLIVNLAYCGWYWPRYVIRRLLNIRLSDFIKLGLKMN